MSYYPSTQGISRAELEEEFHDESDILGDSLSSHHQYWDRISDYIDPLSSASGLPTDTEAAAALSLPVVEATYIAQGVPVEVEDEKEESASRSRSRYSYFSGLPRTSKGGSRVASTSQGGATQSFAPSHYVTGDMPSAAGTRASLWQNRRQLMEEAQASLVQENKRKSPVHLRGYARTGPYGRSFSWPVLCCLVIGGPLLVILGRGDKETPDMSDAPTMRPTESTNIRPPTSQPSLPPTEQPLIAPSLSPTLSPTEPPIVVDFTVEPILHIVHANTPVPLSVLVPSPLSSVAIYEGEYLAVGDMCNETNATMWFSSFDFKATEQSTNIFVRPTETNTTVQIGFEVDLTQAIDSTMVLCVNDSVVATAYHLFPENITEQDAEFVEMVDFTALTNDTATQSIVVEEDILLLLVTDVATSMAFWSETNVTGLSVEIGDECFINNATTLLGSSRDPFPVTFHLLTTDQVIYGCNASDVIVAQLIVSMSDKDNANMTESNATASNRTI